MSVGPILTGGEDRRPRFLAIHPPDQKLFLSVAGEYFVPGEEGGSRIDVIDLTTGQDRMLLDSNIGSVSGMTVDWATDGHLYWADILNKRIEAVTRDGEDRREVVSEGIVEIVGLAVQFSWLYWADRDQAVVVRVDKITGTNRQVVLSRVSRLSSLTSVIANIDGRNLVAENNPCQSGKLCSHFCSFKPASGAACGCPTGLSLGRDNATCGLPPTCKQTEFTCLSKGRTGAGPACIPAQWRCDGQTECGDRSDELDCPECGPGTFRCQSGQCVPASKLCDGVPNCDDKSDETTCCPAGQFQCVVTGECVPADKLCDGEHDCGDSSDELLPKCPLGGGGSPCCPDPQVSRADSEASTATTSTYLIAVFAGLISVFLLSLIVVYCKRKNLPLSAVQLDNDLITRPLASGSKETVTAAHGPAGGREPGVGAGVTGPGSSNGVLYDRSQLTGASSSVAGTSSSGQQAGPPPSPATSVATKLSRLMPSGSRTRQLRPGAGGAFNAGMPTSYRYYTQHRGAAPPCTPCSTDVNDESDSLAYSAFPHHRPHFPSRAGSVAPGYDSETYAHDTELPSLHARGHYAPPPTTPLYLSDYGEQELSPPASPTTERSFFLNPCIPGPPPSPVPGPPP